MIFDRRPEGRRVDGANVAFYLLDSFRYGFFFNLATLERAVRKCKSILPSSLLALVRARVNHGKQTSLFHNAAVKRSRGTAAHRTRCSCQISVYA